jgi:hypothetical protein
MRFRDKPEDEPSELAKQRAEHGTTSKRHRDLNAVAGIGRARHRNAVHAARHTRTHTQSDGEKVLLHTTKVWPWKKKAKNRARRKHARKQAHHTRSN